jgi:hypothetical protein
MLAQLLTKSGIGARIVGQDAADRAVIDTLPVEGVRVICLCYLELTGNSSHLRYLVRRLRRHVPNTPIIVTLWPTDDEAFDDERSRNAIAADLHAASFREVVVACLEHGQQKDPAQGNSRWGAPSVS